MNKQEEKKIVEVLEHLNEYWDENASIGYLLEIYKSNKKRMKK